MYIKRILQPSVKRPVTGQISSDNYFLSKKSDWIITGINSW